MWYLLYLPQSLPPSNVSSPPWVLSNSLNHPFIENSITIFVLNGSHSKRVAAEAIKSRGEGDEQCGVTGGYHHQDSSVLAHLFSAHGKFYYFSCFFIHFLYFSLLYFSSSSEFQEGMSPSLKNLRRTHTPASTACDQKINYKFNNLQLRGEIPISQVPHGEM